MRSPALLACALVSIAASHAQNLPDSTAADRSGVSVTVYNQNLGLVRETRTLKVDRAGVSFLRFMDFPQLINPRTVHLKSLTAGADLDILEQNYEYDLISPDKLLEKYVGDKPARFQYHARGQRAGIKPRLDFLRTIAGLGLSGKACTGEV